MIAIKTMDSLPEYCYECPCHDAEHGRCNADEQKRGNWEYRPYWCPLILCDDAPENVGEMQMSQATQCDRCKKYFRIEEQSDNEESVKLHDVTTYTRDNKINHTFSWGTELIDLCPACAKAFRLFMDCFDILPVEHIEEDRKKDTADSEKDGV